MGNNEVRRSSSMPRTGAAKSSAKKDRINTKEQAKRHLQQALRLIKGAIISDPAQLALVQKIIDKVRARFILISIEDIDKLERIPKLENQIHLRLPISKLNGDKALDYALGVLIYAVDPKVNKPEINQLIAQIKSSQDTGGTIREDEIIDIVQDLSARERLELKRKQAERIAQEPKPEKPKDPEPHAIDTNYLREIALRYSMQNRSKNIAWQGETSNELDMGLNRGTDVLASVIAKISNCFLTIRSRELKDKTMLQKEIPVLLNDLVNNLAVYIAVHKNSDTAVLAKMLEAVSRLKEKEFNPVFFNQEPFANFKKNLTSKLSGADISSQRARDFTAALTGTSNTDQPLLTAATNESVVRIGMAGSGTVAGYLGSSSSDTSTTDQTSFQSLTEIDPLVNEMSLFTTAIPSIESLAKLMLEADLSDLRAIQKIIPEDILRNLDKALKLENSKESLEDGDPLKELNPIEEYLKMLVIALRQTSGISAFTKKAKIESGAIQFTLSQILLAFYAKINDRNTEIKFRAAINNLSKLSEFKELNQFIEDQRSFVKRRLEEGKTKDKKVRINKIRQKRIGKPGTEEEHGDGRAGLLATITRAQNNQKPLADLELFDKKAVTHAIDASGFLHRLSQLENDDILMLNSSLDEAKILMLYLVNGMKALGDLKLQKGLDGEFKLIPVLDPSEEDSEKQFKYLKLEDIQASFDKARTITLGKFHPDRAAALFKNLTGKDEAQHSIELAKQCYDWLSKAEKVPEFGIGWQEDYFGNQLNEIYNFVRETDLIDHIDSEAAVVEPSRAKKLLGRLSHLEERQGLLGNVLSSITRIISSFKDIDTDSKKELQGHLNSLSA